MCTEYSFLEYREGLIFSLMLMEFLCSDLLLCSHIACSFVLTFSGVPVLWFLLYCSCVLVTLFLFWNVISGIHFYFRWFLIALTMFESQVDRLESMEHLLSITDSDDIVITIQKFQITSYDEMVVVKSSSGKFTKQLITSKIWQWIR